MTRLFSYASWFLYFFFIIIIMVCLEEFSPNEVKRAISVSEWVLQNLQYYPFQNYIKVYSSTSHQFSRNWKPHPLQQEFRRERIALVWGIPEVLPHASMRLPCPGSLSSLLRSPNCPVANRVFSFTSSIMSLRGTAMPCMGPRYSEIELLIMTIITITLLACSMKISTRKAE